jgi:hypothetical protein
MHTLVDFITHVKGIEYILSIIFIAGFLLLWEVLKPRPFATVITSGKEDWNHLRGNGYRDILRSLGKIAAAPFIGLAYILIVPIGFFFLILAEAVNLLTRGIALMTGRNISFEWNPVEAYFTGRKKKQNESGKDTKK